MKQALNRLALYCAAMSVVVKVGRDGYSVVPRGMVAHHAHTITVDELADRVEAINSAPVEFVAGELQGAQVLHARGYEQLAEVLQAAFSQAARGKGKERHAKGQPFHEQVMQVGAQHFGTGALLFQAFKKSEESQRLPHERAEAELLGAIVYLAGAVIAERRKHADLSQAANDPSATVAAHA
jgi:hypothetical protein